MADMKIKVSYLPFLLQLLDVVTKSKKKVQLLDVVTKSKKKVQPLDVVTRS
jgi:hypothetical protein